MDLRDLADMQDVAVGNTRKDKCIDRVFTNSSRGVVEAGTLAPLETEEDRRSDHRVVYVLAELPRRETFRWEVYKYRHFSDTGVEEFKNWIVMYDWA